MVAKNQSPQIVASKLAKKVFLLLGVPGTLEVVQQDEGLLVDIKTDNPALLIGFHGETLAGLQLILSLMLYRQLGDWTRLSVDVDGYLQRRQETLEKMAQSAVQRARFSQKPYALPPMNARERRLIHLALANVPDVQTESQGEEPQRCVVVKIK